MQILNLLGVAALAVLCGFQWRNDSLLNHRIIGLEEVKLQQIDKIASLELSLQEKSADLEDFRQRLKISEATEIDEARQLKESQARCAQLTVECDQLKGVRDQLKATLDKWIEAVKTDKEQIDKLVRERDAAIYKFNDLADKYNALVKEVDVKSPQTRPASRPAK
jgi:chromosome segregation ATPase